MVHVGISTNPTIGGVSRGSARVCCRDCEHPVSANSISGDSNTADVLPLTLPATAQDLQLVGGFNPCQQCRSQLESSSRVGRMEFMYVYIYIIIYIQYLFIYLWITANLVSKLEPNQLRLAGSQRIAVVSCTKPNGGTPALRQPCTAAPTWNSGASTVCVRHTPGRSLTIAGTIDSVFTSSMSCG